MSTLTLEAYTARLRAASSAVEPALRAELGTLATEAQTRARALARQRLRVRTGALLASIQATTKGSEVRLRAGDNSRVRYARVQEFGATITPRSGRFLAVRGDTWFRLARQVRIPGQHFLAAGWDAARKGLRERLSRRVVRLIEGARGQ